MTHEEKTRLIAEFDGWEVDRFLSDANNAEYYTHPIKLGIYIKHMEYYKSYDWLMPVWHKFRDLRFEDNHHLAYRERIEYQLMDGNEETLFNALAEAIEWYNTTKK